MAHNDSRDRRTGKIGIERHQQLLKWIADGKVAPEIADLLNVNQETVRKFARKRGLKIRPTEQRLESHPNWKTGTTIDKGGYLLIRTELESQFGYLIRRPTLRKYTSGYAPVHRIEMHKKIGRKLLPNEVVHHIDGDTTNNDQANLELFSSNTEHLRVTLKGKTPKWTDDGIARMRARVVSPEARARMGNRTQGPRVGRRPKSRVPIDTPASTAAPSRNDDPASLSLCGQMQT